MKNTTIQEASINDLIRSGNDAQNNHIEDAGEGIERSQFSYEAGTKRFSIWGLYKGKTANYPFKIDFLRVNAEEVTNPEELEFLASQDIEVNTPYPQSNGKILFVTNYNKVFFLEPMDADSTDVQVRCGCPSYKYAYFTGNKRDRASTGPNMTIRSKGTGTPKPVVPGLCKHLQNVITQLQNNGIIQ